MAIQTKQQQRAEFALNTLKNEYIIKQGSVPKKVATFIVGMPNMILSNGLGQSLAFLKAKNSLDGREFVFKTIKKYLIKEDYMKKSDDDFSFLEEINSVSQNTYIKMQTEVLKMLEWLKRYARAFEKEEKDKE